MNTYDNKKVRTPKMRMVQFGNLTIQISNKTII